MIRKLILSAVLAVVTVIGIQAQTIKGTVVDAATNEGIIGATVVSEDGSKGVITGLDGVFTFTTRSFPLRLTISFIGYKTETVTVEDDRQDVRILLEENASALDEVVVIGYGTQSRTQLTGSVTTVKSEVFQNSTAATFDGALSGQIAGLNVTADSGQPGAASSIRIRGGNSINASNEPLYVVDGFIYFKDSSNSGTGVGAIESSLNPLSTINPNDIESIEVLKDVSATAIYGSRGANGVILITTKKGKVGDSKASISYTHSQGISRVSRKLPLMNATEWAQYQKTYYSNKGGYTDEQIAALGKGTDWQDEALRDAHQSSHELSITGATQKSRYAFSASYTDQDGIIINSGFQRYNFHTNVEWTLIDNLKFGVNTTYGRSKQTGLTTTEQQQYNSSPFSAGITNSFVYALLMPPVENVYNEDGTWNFSNKYEYAYFAIGGISANQIYDLKESVAENINNYLLSNIWASYQLKDLTFKATLGYNSEKLTQNYFSGAYTSGGLAVKGIGAVGNRQSDVWQQEYTINWAKDLSDEHYLDAMVGFTRQSSTSTYSMIRTSNFTNETLKHHNLGDGSNIYIPQTGITESTLNSFIARVNYTLLNRYNATATFRADNSSRFAKNHRWGYFPSLGLSWNIDKERFMAHAYNVDYLKLRATAGVVGNQEIPDYVFSTSYSTGSYAGSSSYTKKNAANDKLKWETTSSYNLGVDLGLFSGKLSFIFDAYYKKTSDLLLEVPVGFASGVSTQYQNVGNVVNKGLELAVNSTLISSKKLTWTVSANISTNKNRITDMGTTDNVIIGASNQQILRKGESVGSFYGLDFIGIVQADEDVSQLPTVNGQVPKPGDLKYADTNGDRKINGDDRIILGSIQPKFTYGFSTQLKFGDFDFSASFAGSVGNKLYNALGSRLEQTGDSYNVLKTIKDSWTPENRSDRLALASKSRPFSYIDSRYVQSASYLKLRNVTIGYRLPLKSSFPLGVRVYLTGSNLLSITSYQGYDPEVSSGSDYGAYPSSRTVLFGVTLSL